MSNDRNALDVVHSRPIADVAADAVQHGHRLVQVEVEHPGADGVALGVRERPDHRDGFGLIKIERQQVALVAQ
jgi:hypothetical protein